MPIQKWDGISIPAVFRGPRFKLHDCTAGCDCSRPTCTVCVCTSRLSVNVVRSPIATAVEVEPTSLFCAARSRFEASHAIYKPIPAV